MQTQTDNAEQKLGLILTGAALRGPSTGTTLLLLAYALGSAASLAIVATASTRVIAGSVYMS